MKSIVVYCGSNLGKKPIYAETAYALGEELAKRNIKVIYGGGNRGLMGQVSDGAMEKGGFVTGIIPNFLAKLENAHKSLSELHFVETMHERKAKMVSLTDGVIALPGGYGTFDELFEILTWAQLRIFNGPIGIMNVAGYYDLLLQQLEKMVEEGFLHPDNHALLVVAEDPVSLLEKMEQYRAVNPENKPLDRSLYIDHK